MWFAEACDAEPDEDRIIEFDDEGNPIEEFPLEQMAGVALEYQPDAATAPELFAQVNKAPRVISEQNAFLIQDLMRDVIRRGTGQTGAHSGSS